MRSRSLPLHEPALLLVDVDERMHVSSGYLSPALLDGWLPGGEAMQDRLPG